MVIGAGERAALVGTPRYAVNTIRMPFEHAQAAPRLHVPQPDCIIKGAREGTTLVGAPRYLPHVVAMPFEHAQTLPRLHVPQPDRYYQRSQRGHDAGRDSTPSSPLQNRYALRARADIAPSPRPTASPYSHQEPERARRWSGLHATLQTLLMCPSSTRRLRPVSTSHSLTI